MDASQARSNRIPEVSLLARDHSPAHESDSDVRSSVTHLPRCFCRCLAGTWHIGPRAWPVEESANCEQKRPPKGIRRRLDSKSILSFDLGELNAYGAPQSDLQWSCKIPSGARKAMAASAPKLLAINIHRPQSPHDRAVPVPLDYQRGASARVHLHIVLSPFHYPDRGRIWPGATC